MSELQNAILAMCGSDDGATAEAGHRLLDLYDTFELKLRQQLEAAQSKATRPAPCEHACESRAFEIEIRQLKAENERLQSIIKKAQGQTPLYANSQIPADHSDGWNPITEYGQISVGDWLSFSVDGKFICATAKEILNAGHSTEEIIYNRKRNHYFISSLAINGQSSHKDVRVYRRQTEVKPS